jgi:hypothetical protein
MKKGLLAIISNPFFWVIGFASIGAISIVGGIEILAGNGLALITFGGFLIAAARYITKGLKPNG